jgi:hypothetical protein
MFCATPSSRKNTPALARWRKCRGDVRSAQGKTALNMTYHRVFKQSLRALSWRELPENQGFSTIEFLKLNRNRNSRHPSVFGRAAVAIYVLPERWILSTLA